MPSLLSFAPGATTGFCLSSLGLWRLAFGCTVTGNEHEPLPWLALQIITSPSGIQQVFQRTALARVSIPVASSAAEVDRVTSVILEGGTVDNDMARLTEAFSLFKNNPRVKGDVYDATLVECKDLLRGYWDIRLWLEEGYKEQKTLKLPGSTTLLLMPS